MRLAPVRSHNNNNNSSSKLPMTTDLMKAFQQPMAHGPDTLKLSLTPSIVTFIQAGVDCTRSVETGQVTSGFWRRFWQLRTVALLAPTRSKIGAKRWWWWCCCWVVRFVTAFGNRVYHSIILFICSLSPTICEFHVLRTKSDILWYTLSVIHCKSFCVTHPVDVGLTQRRIVRVASAITSQTEYSRSTAHRTYIGEYTPILSPRSERHPLLIFDRIPTKACCPTLFGRSCTALKRRTIFTVLVYVSCLLMLCTGAYPTDHQTSSSTNSYNNQLQSNNGISYPASRDYDYPNHVDLNRVKHVQSYFESDHIIPNRTELRAQTPNYIFQLHQRHMNQWWNFDQLETNNLPHPIRAHMGDGKSRWNRRSLGAITAVRHHKHIGTFEDVSASNHPFARPSVAHFPAGSHLRGHRLMFRLAEMPEDEQLIAASLRLRYDPIKSRNSSGPTERIRTHCRQAAVNQPHHYWPITLWLHYDMHKYRPARWDLETIASFEPDTLTCEVENQTVMHLPPGWFHIPLSAPILSLLQKINFRTNPDKYVTIRVRSLTHRPEGYDPLDQLKLYPKSREPKHLNDWLHEAPHLFTYHRDSEMDTEKKRTRRSVQEVYNTNSHQKALNSEDLHAPKSKAFQHKPPVTEARMDLRTRATRGTSFEQRYRKLQRMLHSGLRKAGQKHRPRRRAFYPRRNSRASPDNWHDPAATNVAPYYYASSRNPHMDAVAQNEYNELKDGFHGQNMANDNSDVYGSSPAVNGFDESVNIESSSQSGTDDYLDSTCQRRDLIIDFDAVGWAGWVIAPQAYNARYCRGQCPFPLSTHYNTTNHAVLLQLVHLLDAARISGPCCVPNQLSSQSLLYHKQNGDVVLRVYQDMVVESCACR